MSFAHTVSRYEIKVCQLNLSEPFNQQGCLGGALSFSTVTVVAINPRYFLIFYLLGQRSHFSTHTVVFESFAMF